MFNKTEKYAAIAALGMLTTLWACQRSELPVSQNSGKTPIELTVGIVGENASATKSVVTTDTPYGQSAAAFAAGTSLYMVMKSEKANTDAVYTRTIGYAQEAAATPANSTTVKFASAYGRFWEDSHSRDSQLSVYAACVPGYYLSGSKYDGITANGTVDETTWTIGGSTTYNNVWGAGYGAATIAWPLRSATVGRQNAAFITNQDLCFSNNVSKYTVSAVETDNRVTFNADLKKFGSGRLVFYHALTKVTFRIKKGEGFQVGDPFAFTNANENIVLKGFNTSGTFDIVDGEFKTSDPAIGTGDITELYNSGASGDYAYVLTCLMLPGTDLNNTEADKIYFTIDGNLYHLKKKDLMDALAGKKLSDSSTDALTADHKMRAGVHYIFDMTVGKKKMDSFTAAVVPWEDVEADETTPSNARIVLSFFDPASGEDVTADTPDIDLYRTANTSSTINDNYESYDWKTGYAPTANPMLNKAQLHETATDGLYSAEETVDPYKAWYWPDNKTFYHFRMVMPKTDGEWYVYEDGTNGDYITLAGHVYSETPAESFKDVCWGAPFKPTDGKLTYSLTTGFDNQGGEDPNYTHQIQKAIGPTEETINLVLFHMMSDVTIQLTTPQSGDADYDARVNLAGATLGLSNIVSTGKVRMGNGLVVADGATATVNGTVNASYNWRYGFVPQALTSVVLTITTADHNLYLVNMEDVKATTVGNTVIANPYLQSEGKYVINRWYPSYKYTYTFKLTKTDISLITATVADWETVIAGDDNVQIR